MAAVVTAVLWDGMPCSPMEMCRLFLKSAVSFARVDDYTSLAQKSVIFMTHPPFCCILLFVSAPLNP